MITQSEHVYEALLHSSSLERHMLIENIAMAKYALSSGLAVPGPLAERLETIAAVELGESAAPGSSGDSGEVAPPASTRHDNAGELARIHSRLSDIVAPATPRTILLLATETAKGKLFSFLGPVTLIRGMTAMAIACLVAFIAVSLSPHVDTASIAKTIFEMNGVPLLINLVFLLTAAGLGACFASLFRANRYIAEGTFDPKYESSYWVRFVLGLMAGMMLANLIPVPDAAGSGASPLARPALAMLGGFSASVVYKILSRTIESVESLVRGETREIVASNEQALRAELAQKSGQLRIQLAAGLMNLREQLAADANREDLQKELDRLVSRLVPDSDET